MITPDVIMSLHRDRQRELTAHADRNRERVLIMRAGRTRLTAFGRRARRAEAPR